jgi:hypothetical protein
MGMDIRIGKGRINPLLFNKSEADFIDSFSEVSLEGLGSSKEELKSLYKKYGKFKTVEPKVEKPKRKRIK